MVVGQPPIVNPMSTVRGTDTVADADAVGQLMVDVTRIVKRPSRCVGAECGVFWWCAEKLMVAGGDIFVNLPLHRGGWWISRDCGVTSSRQGDTLQDSSNDSPP